MSERDRSEQEQVEIKPIYIIQAGLEDTGKSKTSKNLQELKTKSTTEISKTSSKLEGAKYKSANTDRTDSTNQEIRNQQNNIYIFSLKDWVEETGSHSQSWLNL